MRELGGFDMVDNSAVRISRKEDVLVIVLNRPEAMNAVNEALANGIDAALDELDSDATLRAGVITGAGKGFSAGFDLKAYLQGEAPVTKRGFAGITRQPPEKPLIAAVEGFAFAGGFEIAMSCDLIVAARGVKFGIPETKVGLVAAAGALIRLPKRIPYHVAMYLALSGGTISADRAYAFGLVNELCEPGQALDKAIEMAQLITRNAPLAVMASKAIVRGALDVDEKGGWELQDRLGIPILDTEDAKEGANAFAEKRSPVWKGR